MKKKNKGFFLAETVIVISLVTSVLVFVFPNVSKMYENYVNTTKYYDQVDDLYALKALSKILVNDIKIITTEGEKEGCKNFSNDLSDAEIDTSGLASKTTLKLYKLYIVNYMVTPKDDDDYEFNKYLKRLKKTTRDDSAYRLIGVFNETIDNKEEIRYASIKIPNPGAGVCP